MKYYFFSILLILLTLIFVLITLKYIVYYNTIADINIKLVRANCIEMQMLDNRMSSIFKN